MYCPDVADLASPAVGLTVCWDDDIPLAGGLCMGLRKPPMAAELERNEKGSCYSRNFQGPGSRNRARWTASRVSGLQSCCGLPLGREHLVDGLHVGSADETQGRDDGIAVKLIRVGNSHSASVPPSMLSV